MNNENLNGTLVLVHPQLDDPAKRQGQLGVVNYVAKDSDDVYVGFPTGNSGIYPGESLLRLRNKSDILNELVNHGDNIPVDDFKALYKINIYQDRGTNTGTIQAMEIARDNPGVWDKTLERLNPERKIELQKSFSR